MKPRPIIWDFDGTILPLDPYDSEQTLLLHNLNASGEKAGLLRRWITRAVIHADMKQWFQNSFRLFKKSYIWALKGTPTGVLDRVAEHLAEKITPSDRRAYRKLKADGHRMVVVSCGTVDLSERILNIAGLANCFQAVVGNRFRINHGRITGMDLDVLTPEDKPAAVRARGIQPEQSIVVGDGYSDLPLLDRAWFPILIDPAGEKKRKYAEKNYCFITAASEIVDVITGISVCTGRDQTNEGLKTTP